MNYFCSYFDFNYLSRALVLYRSLERTCRAFHLFGLCMDDEGFKAVEGLKLPWMTAVRLAELEQPGILLHLWTIILLVSFESSFTDRFALLRRRRFDVFL